MSISEKSLVLACCIKIYYSILQGGKYYIRFEVMVILYVIIILSYYSESDKILLLAVSFLSTGEVIIIFVLILSNNKQTVLILSWLARQQTSVISVECCKHDVIKKYVF